MLKEHVVVGKSYVNENACIMREVVEEVDDSRVRFNTFDLHDGKLMPTRHNVWERGQLAHWADREATSSENARAHPYASAAGSVAPMEAQQAGMPPEQVRAARDELPAHLNFPIGK